MKKTVLLSGKTVPFVFKRFHRSKSVRFSLSPGRALLVTAPQWVPFSFIESALHKKQKWILEMLASMPVHPENLYKKHKETARTLAKERLAYWNTFYGFPYERVSIRDQKTRWGSCSKRGNLNFSYKLAILPPHLADYVIVHELCHIKEFNHSEKFWSLVACTVPDYKTCRRELRAWAAVS